MALKRPKWKSGTVVVLEHVSKVLKGNALGDPHVRKLAVWLPPQYDEAATRGRGRRFPVLVDMVGFMGSGLSHVAWKNFSENVPERAARLDPRGEDGARDHRVPRLLHRAGRQPVRELVGHRQLRRLPHEGDRAVRRPRVPHARLARASRLLREVLGRLRRHHPRHEVRLHLGRDRRPLGRRLLRLRLPPRLAQHAQRAGQVPPEEARPRRLRREKAREGLRPRARRRPREAVPRRGLGASRSSRRPRATRS